VVSSRSTMTPVFRLLGILLTLFALTAGGANSANGQGGALSVPGTKVRLVPPAGFAPSDQFPGFADPKTGATILVTETPAPFSKIIEAFTPERLAPQAMALLEKKDVSVNGRQGLLLRVRQVVGAAAYLKWIVLRGTETETVFIAGMCPEPLPNGMAGALEASVLGAEWNPAAVVDALAGLTFSMGEVSGLKFAQRISDGMMFTSDGTMSGKPANGPAFIIGSSLGQPMPTDPGFPERFLKGRTQFAEVVIRNQAPIAIAGLSGTEVVADGVWRDRPNDRVVLYQILLPHEDGYFVGLGFVPPDGQGKYLEIFRSLIRTFRRKPTRS
jgi:hypothetical protein